MDIASVKPNVGAILREVRRMIDEASSATDTATATLICIGELKFLIHMFPDLFENIPGLMDDIRYLTTIAAVASAHPSYAVMVELKKRLSDIWIKIEEHQTQIQQRVSQSDVRNAPWRPGQVMGGIFKQR